MGRPARMVAAGVLGTAAATTLLPAAAHADPPGVRPPRPTAVVGVGADTTEVLFDQLAADYDTRPKAHRLYSWDTRGSSQITPKAGCAPITRPSGSSQGIAALLARQTLRGGRPCLDFARTLRPRLPTDPPQMVFVPFAADGLTWAANVGGNAPGSLSRAQLAGIFSCTLRTWDQVGGKGATAIQPKLPIVGPGIAYFLQQLGVAHLGSCVQTGVPQDEGTDPSISGNPDALVMYDIAKYLSQTVYHHADVHGSLGLGRIDGLSPTVANPASGREELNFGQVHGVASFPKAFVIQESVVMLANAKGALPGALTHLFVGSRSWLCSNPHAQADIAEYGFLPLGGKDCGQRH